MNTLQLPPPATAWPVLRLLLALAVAPSLFAQPPQSVKAEADLVDAQSKLVNMKLELARLEAKLADLSQAGTPSTLSLEEAAQFQTVRPASQPPQATITSTAPAASAGAPSRAVSNKDEARQDLRRAGMITLEKLNALDRQALLGVNGISSENYAAFLAGSRPDPAIERFLLGLGNRLERKRVAFGVAANSEIAKVVEKEAVQGIAEVPLKSDDDVMFRNLGVSISQGFGVAFVPSSEGSDAALGTIIGRWNLLQRSAAGKWNRWVAESGAKEDAQVPFRGKIEYWDRDAQGVTFYSGNKPANIRPNNTLPELTAFGPFIGTAIVGDKMKFGTKEERPWLVGLSTGWGFYKDAASFLYVDAGVAVSPSSGFDKSRFFAGVSLDGVVLAQLLKLTRNAHLPTDGQK